MEIIAKKEEGKKKNMGEKVKGRNNPNVSMVKINNIYESGDGCKN